MGIAPALMLKYVQASQGPGAFELLNLESPLMVQHLVTKHI